MGLFQKSVIKKYLLGLDQNSLKTAWNKYIAHFHNPIIQEHIRNSKEEEYQEGFVRDLFVNVLGYTLKPQPDFNFVLEKKTETDATKSDGALLRQDNVIGVVELKDTETTELDKIEKQVFGYKNKHRECVYVITSNFEKLRFYINDAVDFLDFNLFNLTEQQFALFYLCLHQKSIEKDLPLKMKQASLAEEESVTKKLYADYSQFKRNLFSSLVQHNPQYDKLELFKKTQKLLDRFLFLLFAEDRLLLPVNSVRGILEEWEKLKELDNYVPLYERFKKFFGYLNTGHDWRNDEIFAYNGGLFAPDDLLDNISIDDKILNEGTRLLSSYDFESEVDVNILGHIFEHSLSEIEEVQAELAGNLIEKSKTKRKKDGVFYTPRYITKYIVENTVGTLCQQKKQELNIIEEDYIARKFKTSDAEEKRKKKLLATLDTYRSWLFQLTICDPACGSGAFLNQALEFLIAEHRYIDELKAKLFGDLMVLSDVETTILENNLFGVDINEEAIEIARLSLWLRTARKGRKLNDLSKNIKCGNSLIDDPAVAGSLAFNWKEQFPQIFDKGGFDVIIGNPPYLRVQGLRENFQQESIFYENNYVTATGRFDIYVLFIEKAISLINETGLSSFILPHKFMISNFGEGARRFLLENKCVKTVLSFGANMVFEDASTYTCIIVLSKNNTSLRYKEVSPLDLSFAIDFDNIDYSTLSSQKWNLQNEEGASLFVKLNSLPYKAKDIFYSISQGIVSVGDDIFILQGTFKGDKFIGYSKEANKEIEIEASLMKPLLKGDDVKKYSPISVSSYVIYPHYLLDKKTVPYEENEFREKFPLAYSYFLPFKEKLIEKKIRYKTNPKYWYALHRSREISLFEQEKLVTPETSLGTNMTLDSDFYYHNTQIYSFIKKEGVAVDYKFLLAILNSNLLWYYLKKTGNVLRGGFFRFKTAFLEPFPIPDYEKIDQTPFINCVNTTLAKKKELTSLVESFKQLLLAKFENLATNKKIDNWTSLSFKEFSQELAKQKIKLSLSEEAEWLKYFEEQKSKATAIQQEIDDTDKQIDQLVYNLYGLTDEEKSIIENA